MANAGASGSKAGTTPARTLFVEALCNQQDDPAQADKLARDKLARDCLTTAVDGSEELAREYVASPEDSSHVTGHAVDIGSLDAQLWLGDRGREWGLCQTYANERWHFEKATEAGGECPIPHPDARG